MHFVDPLKHPQRFAQQADALIRQSLAAPDGPDAFALIDARLEASFEALVDRLAEPEPSAQAAPVAPAGGPVTPLGVQAALPPLTGLGMGTPTAAVRPGQGLHPAAVLGASPMLGGELESLVGEMSGKYGVPSWLIRNVIHAESAGNPQATSSAGAMGLMQLMPATAASLGVTNPYDARQNVEGGVRYMRQLIDRFGGDLPRAVAAYNAGPGNVDRYDGVPPFAETQAYVQRVLE